MGSWSRGLVLVLARVALCVLSIALVFSALVCGLGGHLALALVPLGIGALLALAAVLHGRRVRAAFVGALVLALSYSAVRIVIVREPQGWSVCVGTRCTEGGPWLARLLPEAASLDAGLVVARWVGIVTAAEARSYASAFAPLYAGAPVVPNALLLHSAPGCLVALVHEPPGDGKVPAIVFLHGFGGLSTAYLLAMDRAELSRFVIVAPALDTYARWDTAAGAAVIDDTIAALPARVDRSRVLLVAPVERSDLRGALRTALPRRPFALRDRSHRCARVACRDGERRRADQRCVGSRDGRRASTGGSRRRLEDRPRRRPRAGAHAHGRLGAGGGHAP